MVVIIIALLLFIYVGKCTSHLLLEQVSQILQNISVQPILLHELPGYLLWVGFLIECDSGLFLHAQVHVHEEQGLLTVLMVFLVERSVGVSVYLTLVDLMLAGGNLLLCDYFSCLSH